MYNYEIFDAHCDTLWAMVDRDCNIRKNNLNIDVERMKKYRSYTQMFACFIDPENRTNAMERFNRMADCFYSQDFAGMTPILSVESADMIRSTDDVVYLYNRGVRMMTLTWNDNNQLAGGAYGNETGSNKVNPSGELTELGKAVVKKMNSLGMIIDVSHLNDKSFYEVAKINTGALAASHSNSRSICNSERNLTDDMFKIICETGGVVGINIYPPFLTSADEANVKDVIKHIEHFISLGGENNIGIGADFDGTFGKFPTDIKGCEDLHKIFDEMICLGYDNDIIEKISHKNFKRIFKR